MDDDVDSKGPRRKRVSRACDRCRLKKDKCDGARPSCSACNAAGQTCSYDPSARKRGLPEGYVRGLEKLWALSICNIDGFEDAMLHLLGATERSRGRRDRLIHIWKDDACSDSLHEAWKSSRLWGALETLLTPTEQDARPPRKRCWEEDSHETSDMSASSHWGYRVTRGQHTSTAVAGPRVVDPSSPVAKKQRTDSPAVNSQIEVSTGEQNATHNIPLPAQTDEIVEAYFSQPHLWFPIIPKHNMLRASYLYANGVNSSREHLPSSGDYAVLWAILSYTVGQGFSGLEIEGNTFGHDPAGKCREYYRIARSLIPSEAERFDIGHVQALLLLTLVNVGLNDWTAAWLLSGQAGRMAEAMDLSKSVGARKSDEQRRRKATFMGCFIIDSILSVRLSRSPCLRSNDVPLELLDEDGLEEWNSWTDVLPSRSVLENTKAPRRGPLQAVSCFNRLFELSNVLNKIAWDFPRAKNIQAFTQQILLDLETLDDRLPANCRLMNLDRGTDCDRSPLLPHQTYFHMVYTATLLFLYGRQLGRDPSTRRPTTVDKIVNLLSRALEVQKQHAKNFQTCSFPPLLEFPSRSILESAFAARQSLESFNFSVHNWVDLFIQQLFSVTPLWPVFVPLSEKFGQVSPGASQARAFNSVDVNPFSELGSEKRKSPPENHNQILNSLFDSSNFSPHFLQTGNIYETTSEPSTKDVDIPAESTWSGTTHSTTADILHSLQKTHEARSNTDTDNTRPLFDPRQRRGVGSSSSAMFAPSDLSSATIDMDQSPQNAGAYNRDQASSSPNDLDSIFKDLAYIDTTKWANNREEDLREFGFMDDTTFQAFCHDPDRLVGSRPLVLPTVMSIADIWPPPGFFPEAFQSSERNEAN